MSPQSPLSPLYILGQQVKANVLTLFERKRSELQRCQGPLNQNPGGGVVPTLGLQKLPTAAGTAAEARRTMLWMDRASWSLQVTNPHFKLLEGRNCILQLFSFLIVPRTAQDLHKYFLAGDWCHLSLCAYGKGIEEFGFYTVYTIRSFQRCCAWQWHNQLRYYQNSPVQLCVLGRKPRRNE